MKFLLIFTHTGTAASTSRKSRFTGTSLTSSTLKSSRSPSSMKELRNKCRERRDLRVTPFSGTNSYLSLFILGQWTFLLCYAIKASISAMSNSSLPMMSSGAPSVMRISFSKRMPMPSSFTYRPGSLVTTIPGS